MPVTQTSRCAHTADQAVSLNPQLPSQSTERRAIATASNAPLAAFERWPTTGGNADAIPSPGATPAAPGSRRERSLLLPPAPAAWTATSPSRARSASESAVTLRDDFELTQFSAGLFSAAELAQLQSLLKNKDGYALSQRLNGAAAALKHLPKFRPDIVSVESLAQMEAVARVLAEVARVLHEQFGVVGLTRAFREQAINDLKAMAEREFFREQLRNPNIFFFAKAAENGIRSLPDDETSRQQLIRRARGVASAVNTGLSVAGGQSSAIDTAALREGATVTLGPSTSFTQWATIAKAWAAFSNAHTNVGAEERFIETIITPVRERLWKRDFTVLMGVMDIVQQGLENRIGRLSADLHGSGFLDLGLARVLEAFDKFADGDKRVRDKAIEVLLAAERTFADQGAVPSELEKALSRARFRYDAERVRQRLDATWALRQEIAACAVSCAPLPAPAEAADPDEPIPNWFLCPITHDIMEDPVVGFDGNSYEASSLLRWLASHNRMPMTNQPVPAGFVLTKNRALREAIEEWRSRQPAPSTPAATSEAPCGQTVEAAQPEGQENAILPPPSPPPRVEVPASSSLATVTPSMRSLLAALPSPPAAPSREEDVVSLRPSTPPEAASGAVGRQSDSAAELSVGSFNWQGSSDLSGRYVGQHKLGVPEGEGILTWPDGKLYEGEWRNGKPHGQGICTYPNGERYEGAYQDGTMYGQGVYTFSDGRRYEGCFSLILAWWFFAYFSFIDSS